MRRYRSFRGKWLLRAAVARGWLFSMGVGMLSVQAMPVDAAQSGGIAAHDLDVEATIAQTVYDCSLTKKAAAQQVDEQIRGQLRAIDRLRAQGIRARTQLAAAQRAFIRDLSAKDRAYAEAIERFRRDVTDLAATPQGKAALAQFNAGQEVEALAILDQLQAARDGTRTSGTRTVFNNPRTPPPFTYPFIGLLRTVPPASSLLLPPPVVAVNASP